MPRPSTETPVYDVVRTPLDGSAVDTLLRSRIDKIPTSVTPDGRGFSYAQSRDPTGVFVRTGNDAPRQTGTNNESRNLSVISPDGRWIAYREQSSGSEPQIYVQSLATPERRQVSPDGGDQPRWSKQGREIVYRLGDDQRDHQDRSRSTPNPCRRPRHQRERSLNGRDAAFDDVFTTIGEHKARV